MTDIRPTKRESKTAVHPAAAAAKKAPSTSLFRFLSSKKPSAPPQAPPPSAGGNLNTARQLAPTPSKSTATTVAKPSQSKKTIQPQIPAAPAPTSTQLQSINNEEGFHQRKLSHPPPLQSMSEQELMAKIENLTVSTPPNSDHNLQFGLDGQREVHPCESEPGTDPLETINSKIIDVLYKNDNERWTNFWTVVEEATQVKRENIAYVIVGICAVLSVWSSLGDSVCTFVGFAYPSVATYKILNPSPRAPPVTNAECIHWFRYWSIFAFIQCVDVIFGKIFSVFPLYQICKVLLFLAAQYSHWNVSGFVYSYAVMPVVKWMKKFSDKYIFNKQYQMTAAAAPNNSLSHSLSFVQ